MCNVKKEELAEAEKSGEEEDAPHRPSTSRQEYT
jgi:hypothetical protein